MSDFHKQKAEKKKNAKLIFSAESLEQWKQQQIADITDKIMGDAIAKIEQAQKEIEERETYLKENEMKIKREACSQAFVLLIGIPLMILHDEYGWRSRKRLPEFGQHICDYYQEFDDSEMTIEEYRQFLTDYVGWGFELDTESEEEQENDRTETV